MSQIDPSRLLLGGLAAGVILNIGEFLLNEVLFKTQLEETVARLHIQRPGIVFNSLASALTLLLGIVIVFLYALIRSRLGPGPKTALVAGAVVWFCIYFYSGILTSVLLGLRKDLLLIGLVWGAFEYSLAALGGAALYREK
jgi:hypothetical protein